MFPASGLTRLTPPVMQGPVRQIPTQDRAVTWDEILQHLVRQELLDLEFTAEMIMIGVSAPQRGRLTWLTHLKVALVLLTVDLSKEHTLQQIII